MRHTIRITAAEWEVMEAVWAQSPVAATAIVQALEGKRQWSLATVRTLLGRLVNKGVLQHKLEGKRYLYMPSVSRDACVLRESDSFLDRVLGRAPSVSLVHLVKKAALSRKDIQELRRILREKEERK